MIRRLVLGGLLAAPLLFGDDLPSVDLPGIQIDPVGNNGSNSSSTVINSDQFILGAT